jgi:hypothetical protein
MNAKQVAEKAIDYIGGMYVNGDERRLIVSVTRKDIYFDAMGSSVLDSLVKHDEPGRAEGQLSVGIKFVMAFGVVSKMRDNDYFRSWLALATTLEDGLEVVDVILVSPTGVGKMTIEDIFEQLPPDQINHLIDEMMAFQAKDNEWCAAAREYARVASGCRPILGEKWFSETIKVVPFLPKEVMILELLRRIFSVVPPDIDNPVAVKVLKVIFNLDDASEMEEILSRMEELLEILKEQ